MSRLREIRAACRALAILFALVLGQAGTAVRAENAPSRPAESPPVVSPGEEPSSPGQSDSSLFPIHFSPGDAHLSVDSRAILEYVAQTLHSAHQEQVIRLEGRTDGKESGEEGATPEGRLALSRARVEAVRDFLTSQGLPGARFEVVALGDTAPLGPLETPRDLERNRSVTFVVAPGASPRPPGDSPVAAQKGNNTTGTVVAPATGPSAPTRGASPTRQGSAAASGEGGGSGGTGAPRPADVVAITIQEAPRGPTEVDTVQLGLKILRREGPGAGGSGRWPVQEFLQQQLDDIEQVCRNGLRDERGLAGDTQLQLEIDETGAVESVLVVPPVPQAAYEQKLSSLFKSLTFPPPTGKGRMRLDMVLSVSATFRPVLVPAR